VNKLCRPALAIAAGFILAATQQGPTPLRLEGGGEARLVWTRTFASPGNDWINDIVPLGDGSQLAVGFLNRVDGHEPSDWRALAVRLNAEGTVLARHEYGAGGGIDAFWSAQPMSDGRLALAGFTTRIGGGGIDGWSLIAGADGKIVREQAFGGGGYDRFTDVAPAADGHVFLGHSQLADEEVKRRVFIVKTDGEGQRVWERIHGGPDSYGALYVEPAGDGGFLIAGGITVGENSDVLVMKVDAEGREIWRRSIGSAENDDVNHGLVVLADGRIVVLAYSQSWGARGNDILAATLAPDGSLLKRAMLGGAGDDRPILAKADAEGRIWIIGYTNSAGAGGWDVIVARLGRDGAFEPGALTLGGPKDDNGTAISPLADGSALIAGYSRNLGSDSEDAFVARLADADFAKAHPAFIRRAIRD
jgi:uncharacterized delta-60 repeat protein